MLKGKRDLECGAGLTDDALECLDLLDGPLMLVRAAQERHGFEQPTAVDTRLAGLVQAWGFGLTWDELLEAAPLVDEGDVARLVRRTIDVLRQLERAPGVRPAVYHTAREAAELLERPPVADVLDADSE